MELSRKLKIKSILNHIVPFQYRYSFNFRRNLSFLMESMKWDDNRMKEYQDNKLREVLLSGLLFNPYYKKLFKGLGLKKNDIINTKDIYNDLIIKIPFLSKEIVRKEKNNLLNGNITKKKYVKSSTSGSTGEPLEYYNSKKCIEWEKAFYYRHLINNGYSFGDKTIYIRTYIPKSNSDPPYYYDPYRKIFWFSAYHMNENFLVKYVEIIIASKIKTLIGYPTSLALLARYCDETKICFSMNTIITASEVLIEDDRNLIEKTFNCRVGEYYGLSEKIVAFGKCRESVAYHNYPEYGYYEIIDKKGNILINEGDVGEIVGTNFTNVDCMPWIRYKTGDLAILFRKKKCICGLNTDLIIEQIIGRTDDLLISIDGNAIPGVNIYSIFKKYSSMIRQFRLNQTSGAILNVEIVPTKYFLNSIKEEIINDLKLRLGKDMQIIIHFEKKIKRGSNNKIRVINRNFEEDTFV